MNKIANGQVSVIEASNQLFEAQASMERARGVFDILHSYFEDESPDIRKLQFNWRHITTLLYVLPDYLSEVDEQMKKAQEAMAIPE